MHGVARPDHLVRRLQKRPALSRSPAGRPEFAPCDGWDLLITNAQPPNAAVTLRVRAGATIGSGRDHITYQPVG
jgi:hypothetical protein